MKYLKIRIKDVADVEAARKAGQPTLVYPEGYHNLKFVQAGYITEKATGHLYVLGAVENKDSSLDTVKTSADTTEINKAEAINFSESNEDRIEKITDPGKLIRLQIKASLGQQLTPDELKALDPNDLTPGLRYSQILADKLP